VSKRSLLRNTRIARKLGAIFIVVAASLCGIELVNLLGMQSIAGNLRSANDSHGASKMAGMLDIAVRRAIAAQNEYLRMGGDDRAAQVSTALDAMKHAASTLKDEAGGLVVAAKLEKVNAIVGDYATSFGALYAADHDRMTAGAQAAKAAEGLSAAFTGLATGATNSGSRSMLSDITATYGTFSRLSASMARFSISMANRDEAAASSDLNSLEKQVAGLQSNALLGGLKAEHDAARAQLKAFRAAFDQVRSATQALNERQARLSAASDQILALSNGLSREFAKIFDTTIADLGGTTTRARSQSLLLAGAVAVVTAVLFWVIGRSMTGPINALTEAMTSLAERNWATEVVGTDRSDEIGRMARALLIFKERAMAAEALQAQVDADRVRAEEARQEAMQSMAQKFEQTVGQIVARVAQAAREMASLSDQMAQGVHATKAGSAAAAGRSQEAAHNVQSVAAAVEELTSSGRAISEQVEESHRATDQAVAVASKADVQVRKLVEAAGRIGDVTKIISAIASQTNLLALNATIEAASAGEAGKGFAVVASEVKSLAMQTAKATDEITDQITAIQASTNATAAAIQSVGQTISKLNETTQLVSAAIATQRTATVEISHNTQRAFSGTQLAAEDIAGVTAVAEQSGEAAERVRQASNELAIQAGVLGDEVERFIAQVRDN
jgi:methyl-accepting chemotaxis protein